MKEFQSQTRNVWGRKLLAGGVAVAPLFYGISLAQFTREGFDIRRHAISTLTLGDWGWIQSLNFIVTGLLAILAAIGFRTVLRGGKGGAWGPWLIGLFGLGMLLAGLFRPDPGLSFPPGAPDGPPASMSGHAAIHMAAFCLAFFSLVAASLVLARRFAAQGERGWSRYCIGSGLAAMVLILAGMGMGTWVGVLMGIAGLIAFGWVSLLAGRLSRDYSSIIRNL
ncbi:hypothetical protein J31TS4_25920 [Paenibacillus sp. J31TS4]|uniref:DUF998 domain-containing protein n=1 Tax=Paenibacillus sp. J31TS4 TaxID=2807195 RepID=UPI001B141CD8|nr:DUF998 domain-containing protein [Paenibacillus sp. J31TS4]GIP39312.1 hypothetical protein J31TS4_25920 [Paenibacillus sp. J31TS4]